ncbi:MAG: rhodanese-like domain-containing protein [Armatimonadota bacterium]|nr:rhodanese-like domain-containing protein [Armatimonadota bacterium]
MVSKLKELTQGCSLSAKRAYELLEEGKAALIDVRGYDEFAALRAPGAVCIPLPDLERRLGEISTERIVCFICLSGQRSSMAFERLTALGIPNVASVEGGMQAWKRAGLPTVEQKGVIPLERQVRGVAGALVFGFSLAGLLVNSAFIFGALFVGFMLFLSSVTGLCPMLSLLRIMPWNRTASPAACRR